VPYANLLADARVVLVDDCYSFTAEDQPRALADAIVEFAA
jgi:pimeloyl-ACP methyl ester carboxylesterase